MKKILTVLVFIVSFKVLVAQNVTPCVCALNQSSPYYLSCTIKSCDPGTNCVIGLLVEFDGMPGYITTAYTFPFDIVLDDGDVNPFKINNVTKVKTGNAECPITRTVTGLEHDAIQNLELLIFEDATKTIKYKYLNYSGDLQLFNSEGKVVAIKKNFVKTTDGFLLDASTFQRGMYLFKNDNGIVLKVFVK